MFKTRRLARLKPVTLATCILGMTAAVAASAQAQARPAQTPAADDDVELTVGSADTAAPSPVVQNAEVEALKARIAALEATQQTATLAAEQDRVRAAAAEKARIESEAEREREDARLKAAAPSFVERIGKLGLSLSGYIQAQYVNNQLSEDEVLQGGTPLNQDRFSVRRGRLRLRGKWTYARTDFELDASNSRGPTASVRRAIGSFVYPNAKEGALPWLVAGVGLTEIPLGLELQQGQDDILFMERTTGSLALFAGPIDTGFKLESALGDFRLQFAVMNGSPLDDRAGGPSALDPTRAPDFIGRVGVDTRPIEAVRVAGGASFLTGKGFHAGSSATKPSIQFNDANANGAPDSGEQVFVSGVAATPSAKFDRWAVNVDLELDVRTRIGETRIYAEGTLAQNLDRALYVADPVLTGTDQRAILWYVALIQELTEWGFIGARYDVYDPNIDSTDVKNGRFVPNDASIATTALIAGARVAGIGRLSLEYDIVRDKLGRSVNGVPVDLSNNQLTLRLQGRF